MSNGVLACNQALQDNPPFTCRATGLDGDLGPKRRSRHNSPTFGGPWADGIDGTRTFLREAPYRTAVHWPSATPVGACSRRDVRAISGRPGQQWAVYEHDRSAQRAAEPACWASPAKLLLPRVRGATSFFLARLWVSLCSVASAWTARRSASRRGSILANAIGKEKVIVKKKTKKKTGRGSLL